MNNNNNKPIKNHIYKTIIAERIGLQSLALRSTVQGNPHHLKHVLYL